MTDLLTLWLADKVTDVVSDEQFVASEALSMAAKNLRRILYKHNQYLKKWLLIMYIQFKNIDFSRDGMSKLLDTLMKNEDNLFFKKGHPDSFLMAIENQSARYVKNNRQTRIYVKNPLLLFIFR